MLQDFDYCWLYAALIISEEIMSPHISTTYICSARICEYRDGNDMAGHVIIYNANSYIFALDLTSQMIIS